MRAEKKLWPPVYACIVLVESSGVLVYIRARVCTKPINNFDILLLYYTSAARRCIYFNTVYVCLWNCRILRRIYVICLRGKNTIRRDVYIGIILGVYYVGGLRSRWESAKKKIPNCIIASYEWLPSVRFCRVSFPCCSIILYYNVPTYMRLRYLWFPCPGATVLNTSFVFFL